MPLPAAIDADQKALGRIVAGLFAMLGLSSGMAPRRIARSVYSAVGFVLRPAESAVRRLIYLLSLSIRAGPAVARPLPAGFAGAHGAKARCAFRLFDARLRLKRRSKAPRAQPRISFFGDGEVRTIDLARAPRKDASNDGMIDAAGLLRRLAAIQFALEDLPRQARRLKRALQRRQTSPQLKMQGPLRPGFPPGHRIRRAHEIDDILARCHWRARDALPDTS